MSRLLADFSTAFPVDALDPRFFVTEPGCFIYLSDSDAALRAIVDSEDYEFATQWKWSAVMCRSRHGKFTEKFYARRSAQPSSVYLHKEILFRTGRLPPSRFHTIGDHRNGDSLDCRRANLRWATPSMNRKNLRGEWPHDFFEED